MSDWIRGIDHVQVAAPSGCEIDARRFYGELLGLKELRKPESLKSQAGCWFECASGQQLHVGIQDPFNAARKAHPAFAADHFDELRTRIIAHGAEVIDDSAIIGMRRFFSFDPWGNRLEFVERSA